MYKRRGGQNSPGPGTRSLHPGAGNQVDRCFFFLKEPEEATGKGHEDKAGLREAAGGLLWIPDLRDLPCYLRAELQAHGDYF